MSQDKTDDRSFLRNLEEIVSDYKFNVKLVTTFFISDLIFKNRFL